MMMMQCTWYVMHKINSTGFESRYYFKGIVYQGSTEQDTVVSSLMATLKRFSMALALTISLRLSCLVAVSISIQISTTNSVKYSSGADSSYEQVLGHHFTSYAAFKLHIATKLAIHGQQATGQCSFSSNHDSTFYVQLNRLSLIADYFQHKTFWIR